MDSAAPTCGEHLYPHTPITDLNQAQTASVPIDGASNTSNDAGQDGRCQVKCWACHLLVEIPLVGEAKVPSPVFKCGWCGAVTEYMHVRPSRRETAFRAIMRALSALKWGIVAAVLLLTLSIIVPGAVLVLPQTCGSSLLLLAINHALTWLFSFNVLFNFWSAVLGSPGTVKDCFVMPVQEGQAIPKGAFENFRYCYPCKYYKPPVAHHCNVCRTCVVDLDHHCPFINNCVGRANLRSFILFLAWTLAALLFCVLHTGALLFAFERKAFVESLARAWMMRRKPWDVTIISIFIYFSMPWHLLVALWVFGVSVGVGIVAASLLYSQLRYIWKNPLAHGAHEEQPPEGLSPWAVFLSRMQEVMGGKDAMQWLWPYWGPPPGILLAVAKKKL